jgi:hypothetical protein
LRRSLDETDSPDRGRFRPGSDRIFPGKAGTKAGTDPGLPISSSGFALYLQTAYDGCVSETPEGRKMSTTPTHVRPTVVCLCGSTRFLEAYFRAFYEEEHAGRIALTVPCFKADPCCKTPEDHARLDSLHLAKIDLADEILVLNVGGYIGDSTRNEIAYATDQGKRVRYLEPI